MVALRTARDVIDVEGADAASYLHGQLSQDVEGMAVGSSAPTLLLQPQGKVDAWLRLTRLGDNRFWLDVDSGYGEAAMARLQRFKLRVDVEFTLHQHEMVAVRGPSSGAERSTITTGEDTIVVDPMGGGAAGFDLLGPEVTVPDGLDEGASDGLEMLRVRLGIPAMGAELTESTIPAAAGIVEQSVDFTKGCYVGQELVARIDSRGNNTPTRLQGLRFDGGSIERGAELVGADGVVGEVTSVVATSGGAIGLGYVKRGVEVPSDATVIDGAGGSVNVRIVPLPID